MKSFRKALLEYFRENLGIYIFVTSFFLAGIVAGAIMVRLLDMTYLQELQRSFMAFLQDRHAHSEGGLEPLRLLKDSYRKNILFLLLTWALGLFGPGLPFVLLILLLKGLALGFTVGFVVYHFSLKGFVFSLAAVFPHNIFLIPAFIFASTIATGYSYLKLKHRFSKNITPGPHLKEYCLLMLISLLLIIIGGLVEAYLAPVFIKIVVPVFF